MQPVELNPIASTILVVFFILASLLLVGLIGAVAFLVWKLNSILERYEEKIEPVLEKADSVLTLIGEKTDSIGGKAEILLTQGEEMAENVHDKVDRTATAVQQTINAPIIRANSLAAAVTEGWATFRRLQARTARNGNSHSNGASGFAEMRELTLEAANPNVQGEGSNREISVVSGVVESPVITGEMSFPTSSTVDNTPQEKTTVIVGRSS